MELQVPDDVASGVAFDIRFSRAGVTYSLTLAEPDCSPFKIPHRIRNVRCWRFHGVLASATGEASLQARAFVYRVKGLPQPVVELWIGNSSLDRALGDISGDFEVTIHVDGMVAHTEVREGALFYDGTGYWVRYGELPLNPDLDASDLVRIPSEDHLRKIDEANLGWKAPEPYPGFLPGWHPIHGDTRKWAIVTNTNTTGSPMSVGVLPREVGGLQALLLSDAKSVEQCVQMGGALLHYAAQQSRRPFHYYHDNGKPFRCVDHPTAVLGQAGWSTLWSAKQLFGRQAQGLPTLTVKNPYNGGDAHHFETDRLAWGFLLTGSMMCLEQLLSVVEGQRAYPMWKKGGAKVANPRPWAWALRAVTWCRYIHHRLSESGVPLAWTNTDSEFDALCASFDKSVKLDGAGTPTGPFWVFPDGADKRHLYPYPEDVAKFAELQYGLEMPLPSEEEHSDYVALLAQLDVAPNPDKRREVLFKISDYLIGYLAQHRGKEAEYQLKDLYSFVPTDQLGIAIMACLHARRILTAIPELSASAGAAKLRDYALVFFTYLWTRARANILGGTFWSDVGAVLPWVTSGDGTGTNGTQEWRAGACVAIAHEFDWIPAHHREAILALALPMLRNNPKTQPNEPAFYTWGWFEQFFPQGGSA